MTENRRPILIDTHCHIYPDGIARKAVKAVNKFYDGLSEDHHDGTVETLKTSGAACGIKHFIVHSVATTTHQVSSINHFISEAVKNSEGRFTGLGTMHPDTEDPEGDIRELLELGLHGVKMHPDIQMFQVDHPKAMRIFEICEDKNLPVCIHTGDYRYDYSNPDRVIQVLKAFPRLKFIGAHFGGWSIWEEATRRLSDYPNIVVDTSSSFHWLEKQKAKELILAYGPDRVMFGTDYPLWLQEPEIEYLLDLGLPEEDIERICWKNAADYFDIPREVLTGQNTAEEKTEE